MATRIRLSRKGRCHLPQYRVVVADKRSPRDGKFLAQIGTYDPTAAPAVIKFDVDAVMDWLSRGALPSDTVRSLLKQAGIWAKFEAKRKGQDVSSFELQPKPARKRKPRLGEKALKRLEAKKAEAEAAAAAPAEEAPAAEEAQA